MRASEIIVPHSGVGGCTPRPTKLSIAPIKMAFPTFMVIVTIRGEIEFGIMYFDKMCHVLLLMDLAASTYSISLTVSIDARIILANWGIMLTAQGDNGVFQARP